MKHVSRMIIAVACSGLLFATGVNAKEQVYGWELMTQLERIGYREKIRSSKTAEQRERYRMEHHKIMQERAEQRGVTLPDEPSRSAGMQGFGGGQGKGKGH